MLATDIGEQTILKVQKYEYIKHCYCCKFYKQLLMSDNLIIDISVNDNLFPTLSVRAKVHFILNLFWYTGKSDTFGKCMLNIRFQAYLMMLSSVQKIKNDSYIFQ